MFYNPTYIYTTNFAPAINTKSIEMFNATGSGKIVKVNKIEISARPAAAITGLVAIFETYTTSAVGTGGTTLTVIKNDSSDANIPSQITARSKSTVTAVQILNGGSIDIEDARTTKKLVLVNNYGNNENKQITLRENTGICVVQGNLLAVGSANITIEFTLI